MRASWKPALCRAAARGLGLLTLPLAIGCSSVAGPTSSDAYSSHDLAGGKRWWIEEDSGSSALSGSSGDFAGRMGLQPKLR